MSSSFCSSAHAGRGASRLEHLHGQLDRQVLQVGGEVDEAQRAALQVAAAGRAHLLVGEQPRAVARHHAVPVDVRPGGVDAAPRERRAEVVPARRLVGVEVGRGDAAAEALVPGPGELVEAHRVQAGARQLVGPARRLRARGGHALVADVRAPELERPAIARQQPVAVQVDRAVTPGRRVEPRARVGQRRPAPVGRGHEPALARVPGGRERGGRGEQARRRQGAHAATAGPGRPSSSCAPAASGCGRSARSAAARTCTSAADPPGYGGRSRAGGRRWSSPRGSACPTRRSR